MSFQIFDLFGDIRVEGMQEVMGQLTQLGGGLSVVGGQITQFGQTLVNGITKPIVGLIEQGITYNSQIEDLNTSFEVMLGSAENAGIMVDKLKKMGAATPFDTLQLSEYTKTMLSFGYTQENVLPIMSRLGDISLGNNEKMSSLTRTMGQINSLGKLQGGDLNQLIGQGWNPLNEITKKTGETMEQVRDRMSKGKVTYKEVENALISVTSKGGTFYEGMAKGSQTLSGKLSTLRDNFMEFIGSAVKPISDFLGNVLVPKLILLAGYFNNLSTPIKSIILIVGGVAAVIPVLVVAFGMLLSSIAVVITAVGTIGSVLAGISPVVIVVVAAIGVLVAVMTGIYAAMGYILVKTGAVNEIFKLMKDVFNEAKPIVISLVKEGIEKLHQAFVLVKQIFNDIIPIAKPFLLQTIKEAKPIILDIVKALGEFGGALLKNVGEKIKDMKKTWDDVWPKLKPAVEIVFGNIKTIIITVLDVIKGVINITTAIIKGDWSGAWNGIKSIFGSVWDGIKSIASNSINFLTGVMSTIGGKVSNAISSIPSIVSNIASSASNAALSVGSAIVNGIVNGIKNGMKWVANAASDLANSAVTAAKNALGIKSPSKVFQEIGDYINQGFVIGVDENKIKNTMANIANTIKKPFLDIKLPATNNLAGVVDNIESKQLNNVPASINLVMYNTIDKNTDSTIFFNEFVRKLKQSGLVVTHA